MDIICSYRLCFMHAGVLSGRKETGNCILENCEHSKLDFIFFGDKQLKKNRKSVENKILVPHIECSTADLKGARPFREYSH